jgi:sensor c-di-GMP phosphodiesterase-like protein
VHDTEGDEPIESKCEICGDTDSIGDLRDVKMHTRHLKEIHALSDNTDNSSECTESGDSTTKKELQKTRISLTKLYNKIHDWNDKDNTTKVMEAISRWVKRHPLNERDRENK